MNRRLFGLIVASVVALGSMAQTAIARSLEDIIASGVLRVGTYADQPPMASLNNAGEYEGFDIEVANHIAGIMKVSVEIVPLTTLGAVGTASLATLKSIERTSERVTPSSLVAVTVITVVPAPAAAKSSALSA